MEKNKRLSILSDIALILVAAVWGGGFVVVKDALDSFTPLALMSIRFIMASIFVFVFLHRKIGKISRDDIRKGSIVGTFLFLAFAFQTFGLKYTTASKQGFLTATYVVMVPIIYLFLYKKLPSLLVVFSSFLAIIGIGMVSLSDSLILNLGDILTLVCALFFAAHIISIEYFAKDMNVFKLAFLQIFSAAIMFTVSALIFEDIPTDITPRSWLLLGYMSMFATFGCFTVQTIAQKYTSSSHASIILSLESVFAAVFGVLILKEAMTARIAIGCIIIFIAILMIEGDISLVKRIFSRKRKAA